jgi:hypothetical protein
MTHIVLPSMIKKRRGLIINVSSALGRCAIPYKALYSATKRFVDTFSEAIAIEHAPDGIDVQTIMPCWVATHLSGKKPSRFSVKSPAEFVRSALHSVGRAQRCHGCIFHEFEVCTDCTRPLLTCLPTAYTLHSLFPDHVYYDYECCAIRVHCSD